MSDFYIRKVEAFDNGFGLPHLTLEQARTALIAQYLNNEKCPLFDISDKSEWALRRMAEWLKAHEGKLHEICNLNVE